MFHKRLLGEFKNNQKYVTGMVGMQWISLMANVMFLYGISTYLEKMAAGGINQQDTVQLLWQVGVVCLIRGTTGLIYNRFSFRASADVKCRLREMVFQKLMDLGTNYQQKLSSSEIVQIGTEGVEQLEIYFGKYIPQFFYSLLAPVSLFLVVGSMSFKVAVVLLICVPLIPFSIILVQKFAKKMLAKYWGTYTELGDSFLECLQGLTTLKIYQADGRYAQRMDEESEKFRKITMRVLIMQLNSISVMDLIAYGGAAAGMILSVFELKLGNITFSQCFFMIMVSAEFFLPLRLLGSFFHIAMNGNAAADKIFTLIDLPVPAKGNVENVHGSSVVFNHVTFGYVEGRPVLKDISMEIPKGRITAIVGESGCGKSTIVSLLMGKYQNFQGQIEIGGVNILDINENTRYQKITRIRHNSYLFSGTIAQNLAMGKEDATEEEMEAVLKQVDLYDTIMEKGGLGLMVDEKAANLSGGQKQRLALARAILHNSDMYIFDEATSNVDVESENRIIKVMEELAKEKTVIIISHRLENVKRAFQIFTIRDGKLVEVGNHGELIDQSGYYSRLYHLQQESEVYVGGEESRERQVCGI